MGFLKNIGLILHLGVKKKREDRKLLFPPVLKNPNNKPLKVKKLITPPQKEEILTLSKFLKSNDLKNFPETTPPTPKINIGV